jgi:hypothetical protein
MAGAVKKAKQGIPPFGYTVRDGKVYQDAAEQKVIDMILDLQSEGKSIREICRHLTATGIARRRSSLSWHPQVVSNIIQRQYPSPMERKKKTETANREKKGEK